MSEQMKNAIKSVTKESSNMSEADMNYMAGWIIGTVDALKRKTEKEG